MFQQFVDRRQERTEFFAVLVCHRGTDSIERLNQFLGSRRFVVVASGIEVASLVSPNEMEIHGPMVEERRHYGDGLAGVSLNISINQA